jgi:excisionase family DNA binding protein
MRANGRITPRELAAEWGTTVALVLAHIHAGRLRAIDIGVGNRRRWRIDRADVEAFEQARSNTSAGTQPVKRRRTDNGDGNYF